MRVRLKSGTRWATNKSSRRPESPDAAVSCCWRVAPASACGFLFEVSKVVKISVRAFVCKKANRLNRLRKSQKVVILSEAKNPSVVLCLHLDRREILRFAQNDKTDFFRSV